MTLPAQFHLNVQQFGQICVFELSWNHGLRLRAELSFPPELMHLYQTWQRAYLGFYRSLPISPIEPPDPTSSLRGRAVSSGDGTLPAPIDWGEQLSEAEFQLLREFNNWLRHSELYELRARIAAASRSEQVQHQGIDLLLSCSPIELARLPWETWEIGTDFTTIGKIRIARVPINVRVESAALKTRRNRPRILAIIGDETGLDFQGDRQAIRSLSRLAEVVFLGWQPNQQMDDLKTQISRTIADEQGWDVLFFAGHSNETALTGGELGIAPGASLRVSDIAPQLAVAKERGLQFAIFNSCSGLSLAESLIDLGLSQVAVMREPINNRVAQEFLVRFLQGLAEHKDVHESLIASCQHLGTDKKLTHPSAYLIPSLFRHPDTKLFRIPPRGWRQWLNPLLPSQWQAIALFALAVCSLLPPVQIGLLEQRVLLQAWYRHHFRTSQSVSQPSLLLVQIDDASLKAANLIGKEYPLPQWYLAQLIDRLWDRGAKVIGIDYLLDSKQPDTAKLIRSLEQAERHETHFVLAVTRNNKGEWLLPEPEIGDAAHRVYGNADRTWGDDNYHMPLL